MTGPGAPFEVLVQESDEEGIRLPEPHAETYGGPWAIPAPKRSRPYVYINFATSRDGRVSFSEPGHAGGGDVSGFNPHDQWLMALLRARADAIMVGDNTLKLEPDHEWTPEYMWQGDGTAFEELRRSEGWRSSPLQVFLSLDGDLPHDAAVWNRDVDVVVATTERGAATAHSLPTKSADVHVLALGEDSVDVAALMAVLRRDYDIRTLLCEGGPRAYGSLLAAGQVDDEFVTLCPKVIGNSAEGAHRPSLIEGVRFPAGEAPESRIISLRRVGNHLFLRSRYCFPDQ